MGKILAKLEQLFTPGFLQPPIAPPAPPSTPLSDSDSEETFQCRQFMGSILAKLRTGGGRKAWSGGSPPAAAGAAETFGGRKSCLPGGGRGLPFDALPVECKLRVFSFLDVCQRGCAAQVNSEWHELIRSPSLWSNVDLTQIPTYLDSNQIATNRVRRLRQRCRGGEGREAYDARLAGYLARVSDIDPLVHRLSFTYDIYSNHNRFLDSLTHFLSSSRCADLRAARLVWDRFPSDPPSGGADPSPSYAPSRVSPAPDAAVDVSDRQRARQRHFVQFFQSFVVVAPNVSTLELPFDWSARTLDALARLPLRHLSLRPYFECRAVEPEALARLLAGLARLESLTLEAWTASGAGLVAYRLDSNSLRKLDLSQCRGFCFDGIRLPAARDIRLSRRPYCGPLGAGPGGAGPGGVEPVPACLYELLREGAPGLVRFNEHTLREDWRRGRYGELDRVLKGACPCPLHHRGDEGGDDGAAAADTGIKLVKSNSIDD